jgi:hypothetical protein
MGTIEQEIAAWKKFKESVDECIIMGFKPEQLIDHITLVHVINYGKEKGKINEEKIRTL